MQPRTHLHLAAAIALLLATACGAKPGGTADGGPSGGPGTDAGPLPDAGPECALQASCTAPDKTCVGLVDNAGKATFGLRMSEVNFTKPLAFSSGALANTLGGAAAPQDASCNLSGAATFSWLLQFDTTAGTLKTGGARPVADPTQGYSFDTEMLTTFDTSPVTYPGVTPSATGAFQVSTGQPLTLPVFLSADGSSVFPVPLQQARITMGTLSSNNDCIGSYNVGGLDPTNNCQPDGTAPQFITGGSFDGYILLATADNVRIGQLMETLCVLISGDPSMYGMINQTSGAQVCTRDMNGNVVFQGDWCSNTNSAATAQCADSVRFVGSFAASSVLIN